MVKYEYGDTLQFTLKRLKLSSWSGLTAFAEIFDFVQNVRFSAESYRRQDSETNPEWHYSCISCIFGAMLYINPDSYWLLRKFVLKAAKICALKLLLGIKNNKNLQRQKRFSRLYFCLNLKKAHNNFEITITLHWISGKTSI